MAIAPMNVQIGKDKWNDDEIQIWDAELARWRAPETLGEKTDALMALVLSVATKLRNLA